MYIHALQVVGKKGKSATGEKETLAQDEYWLHPAWWEKPGVPQKGKLKAGQT